MSVQVRNISLYISLPSSANQPREMIKLCVVFPGIWNWTPLLNIHSLTTFLEPLALGADLLIKESRTSLPKFKFIFLWGYESTQKARGISMS